MIPWILVAIVVVPLVVIAFAMQRRRTKGSERAVVADPSAQSRTEGEFAEAEAYEAQWHEEDKDRFKRERLP